jgi:RNA polymerase sigma-32 factor
MAVNSLVVMSPEGGLSRYLSEIRKFPMLAKDEEFMLAKRWQQHEDPQAAHRMVTSHLRLVAKIAMGYRGYGLPIGEVISEGNVGLMQAVKKFDPDKGFRLATYAMWWIRASIQEYILRSWSLVKMGTTAAQKKLFFNLRKAKSEIAALQEGDLRPEQVSQIATKLGVLDEEVISMNRRLAGGDASLNSPMRADSESEWQDWLVDDTTPSQETVVADSEERTIRMSLLEEAMTELSDRERHILTERRLKDEPTTLEELAAQYGVSRERVRQIEVRAFEKLQKSMQAAAVERNLMDASLRRRRAPRGRRSRAATGRGGWLRPRSVRRCWPPRTGSDAVRWWPSPGGCRKSPRPPPSVRWSGRAGRAGPGSGRARPPPAPNG